MTTGERIRQRREELSLTQTDLAGRMGYKSRAAISNVEKDKEDLTISRIRKFADALECSPSYLMGWEEITDQSVNFLPLTDSEIQLLEMYNHAPEQLKTTVDYLLKSFQQGNGLQNQNDDKE